MPATSDSQTFREGVYDMKVLFSNPVAFGLLSSKAFNCHFSFSPPKKCSWGKQNQKILP